MQKTQPQYVTGFWKISLNATFYNSHIYHQNEELELPINLKVVTMCSSHLKIIGNTLKSFVTPLLWLCNQNILCGMAIVKAWLLHWKQIVLTKMSQLFQELWENWQDQYWMIIQVKEVSHGDYKAGGVTMAAFQQSRKLEDKMCLRL